MLIRIPLASLLFLSAVAPALSVEDIVISEERRQARERPRRIMMNNDGGDILQASEVSDAGLLGVWSHYLTGKQVDALAYCPISVGLSVFSHRTRWSRADGDERRFIDQGVDPVKVQRDFANRNGMEFFFSLRMNDSHDNAHTAEKPSSYFSSFKAQNLHLLLGKADAPVPHGRWTALDFGQTEVRERVYSIVAEAIDQYDPDGVELDFFRHLNYFRTSAIGGTATDGERAQMTELMERIRRKLDERPGRLLAIRTPDSVGYCRDVGLDLEEWMRLGYVDLYMPSCYFQLNSWEESVKLARRHGVKVYPSFSTSRVERWVLQNSPKYRLRKKPPRTGMPVLNGRAIAALQAGADGIELYNYIYAIPRRGLPALEYAGALETALKHPRVYFVSAMGGRYTMGSFLNGGERYASLSTLEPRHPHSLNGAEEISFETGEANPNAIRAALHLHTARVKAGEATPGIKVVLNGVELVAKSDGADHWVVPGVAPHLVAGVNRMRVTLAPANADALLLDAWVDVEPLPTY